nr:hypothetical protein [Tanacetum cinerariifolium]
MGGQGHDFRLHKFKKTSFPKYNTCRCWYDFSASIDGIHTDFNVDTYFVASIIGTLLCYISETGGEDSLELETGPSLITLPHFQSYSYIAPARKDVEDCLVEESTHNPLEHERRTW